MAEYPHVLNQHDVTSPHRDAAASPSDSLRDKREQSGSPPSDHIACTLNDLAKCLDLTIAERDHEPGYGFGKVLIVRTNGGKELRVNQDDFKSGSSLIEAAIVKVMREHGFSEAHTYIHLGVRRPFINSARPYGSFPGDHYEEYVACSNREISRHWQAMDFHSLIDDDYELEENTEVPNIAYVYRDLDARQVRRILGYSDARGIRAKFTFTQERLGKIVASNTPRLFATNKGEYGVLIPRRDLQPMSSGPEDILALESATAAVRSWVACGQIDLGRTSAGPRGFGESFGVDEAVSECKIFDIPKRTKRKLRKILATPWCLDVAREIGITEYCTRSKEGALAPEYFITLVSKTRWAAGESTDEHILQKVHQAIRKQHKATRGHLFVDPWAASVYFMASRARSLEVGYYARHGYAEIVHPWQIRGFGLFPGARLEQDLAVHSSEIGPSSGQDVKPGHATAQRRMAQPSPYVGKGCSPAGGRDDWTRDGPH